MMTMLDWASRNCRTMMVMDLHHHRLEMVLFLLLFENESPAVVELRRELQDHDLYYQLRIHPGSGSLLRDGEVDRSTPTKAQSAR